MLSSAPGASPALLKTLIDGGTFFKNATPGRLKRIEEYAYIAGSWNGKNEVSTLVGFLSKTEENWQLAILNGLASGIKRSAHKSAPDKSVSKELQKLEKSSSTEIKKAVGGLRQALGI